MARKPHAPKRLSTAAQQGFFAFSVVCGVLAASLMFIAPGLALLVLCFMSVGSLAFFEAMRRKSWELAFSFRLLKTDRNQADLAAQVAQNRDAINQLAASFDRHKTQIRRQAFMQSVMEQAPDPATPANTAKTCARDHEDDLPPGTPFVPRPRKAAPQRAKTPAPAAGYRPLTASKPGKTVLPERASAPQTVGKTTMTENELDEEIFPGASGALFPESEELSDAVMRELVHHAVRRQRVDVFVQPILRLPQRKVRYYEMFARIRARAGLYLPAARYMDLARQDALINRIDQLLLMECLKTIEASAHLERATPFFLNITSATLTDRAFMNRLLGFVSKNRDLAGRLVFEISQQDFEDMKPAVLEIVRGLGRLGCQFSLDHIERYEFDIKLLQALYVRFIKISAQRFLHEAKTETGLAALWKLKRTLEGNGIAVIAEKIESEHMLKELSDFDLTYGQGYLFGRPDLQGVYKQRKAA